MSKAERQLTLMPLLVGNIRLCLFVLNACTKCMMKSAKRESVGSSCPLKFGRHVNQ